MLFLKQLCSLSFLLLSLALTGAKWKTGDHTAYQTSRPLVGRPKGGQYKTILSVDSGGLRGMISSMVVIEIEHSIKQYLLDHPYYLPYHSGITSMDDFDINLVDYFDCMTGISAGSWSTLYLASRGGKGASRAVLDRQDIVEKYGVIPSGGAEGLRVLYKEFGAMIYPPEAIDTSAGEVGDLTNPFAPGVATPLYPLDGLVSTLDAFLGDTTLDDLDTSMLVPAFDLLSSHSVYFVHNMFRDVPVSSSARLVAGARLTHMTIDGRFVPNLVFDESKNYFLKDVGSASGAAPVSKPAMPVTPVDSDSMEFLCIDGVIPMDNSALRAAFFVAGENDFSGLRNIAILTLGNGIITADLSEFANAGLATWLAGFGIFDIYNFSGLESMDSLLDYFYYADPNTKPHQYLRIQVSAPLETEEGMSFTVFDQASLVDLYETIGIRIAKDHRESIDMFVRSFIFG